MDETDYQNLKNDPVIQRLLKKIESEKESLKFAEKMSIDALDD